MKSLVRTAFVGAASIAIVPVRVDLRARLCTIVAGALLVASALASAAPAHTMRDFVGKPTGPIAITFEITPTPVLGRTLEVSITITSGVALDDVTVSFGADESLAFNTPTTVLRLAHLADGATYTTTLSVTPLVIDVLDLAVTVEGDSSSGHEVGTTLIPIRLAAEKAGSPVTLRTAPAGGGLVHSLPAAPGPGRRSL